MIISLNDHKEKTEEIEVPTYDSVEKEKALFRGLTSILSSLLILVEVI